MGSSIIYIANYISLSVTPCCTVAPSTFWPKMKYRIEVNTKVCYNATVEIWTERDDSTKDCLRAVLFCCVGIG